MEMTRINLPPGWEQSVAAAYEAGIRIEMVGGMPVWEAHPVLRPEGCGSRSAVDSPRPRNGRRLRLYPLYRRGCPIPRRLDQAAVFAIYCREPDEEDTAVTLIPEAVVEILSAGYEKKDTVFGVPFYLEQGVKDVILLDPKTGEVTHHRRVGARNLVSPVLVALECGCEVTV